MESRGLIECRLNSIECVSYLTQNLNHIIFYPENNMAENDIWYQEFGAEFWMALSASVFAFFGLALRACLKSRCTKISCCSNKGLVSCDREPVADEFTGLGEASKRPSEESTIFRDVELGQKTLQRTETMTDLQEGS